MQKPLSLAVTTDNQYKELSQNLAKRLALPLYNQTPHNETTDFVLRYETSDDGSIPQLTLSATSGELGGAVTIDFCGGKQAEIFTGIIIIYVSELYLGDSTAATSIFIDVRQKIS